MDPLSRRLRQLYPSVQIRTSDSREFGTNHLLYIDDLKLLAKDEDVMQKMTKETEEYLTHIGLIINRDKSATNSSRCADTARLLEGPETYKYLGITETRYSSVSRGMYSRICEEIKKRVNMLLDTDLSAKNLFRAVNQYALTVPNYYIGVVPMEPYQFARLDRMVRTQLYEKGAHKHCANISRLYLPRKELGRGLHNLEFRAEMMLLNLWLTLSADENKSTRRAAILQHHRQTYSHASLITTYLHDKYGLTIRDNEAIPKTIQHLRKLQNRSLYNVISTTKLHKLLFSRRLDSVDLEESTLWLRKSMLTPQEEAKLINLQDRNLQWMSSKKNHKKCGKYLDVEHLASKCDRLLHTDYVRRHNEVARRIHRTLAKELGVKNIKKVERYKIDDRKFTKNGWISYDMSIHTEKKVQFNRPDIIVADKRENRITIVEIGITSQNNLVKTEMEKKDKYQDLGKQMKFQTFGNHDTEIVIIPWVMTWDGVVTEFHNSYRRQLGISDRMEAQLQRIVLQQSHNFVLRELGVAATGITCECDPARKRQAANMDRGPPLKEREVHASARRPALPSAAPALAVACGA
ncbi:reverse transcriptase domain containing protein [Babesia caballi]|uniref:Reverse transcriptase domain containing protein n=1 Tax=Babesia caballi TaxID=5871 RepID=A0AAV4LN35_BABCB|nr:reverse transcriptase domain containing protein [Babesia caballi]